ncbi:MAG: aspartate/methionine/tyrosine aminotransferase [Candidatus Omnitrophota bacterium]|jgi:aspartate/methionine/tyrosine aminotransferase
MEDRLSQRALIATHQRSPADDRADIAPVTFPFAEGMRHPLPAAMETIYANLASSPDAFAVSPTLGLDPCRQAIIAFERALYGTELAPKQVAIGTSAHQLMQTLMQVLIDPGDKVIFPDPSPHSYLQQLRQVDAKVQAFTLVNSATWTIHEADSLAYLNRMLRRERPKLLILAAPDNPCGHVLSQEFVENAVRITGDEGGFVVIDFSQKELTFDTPPAYFSWGPKDNLILLRSHSLYPNGIGWIEAPAFIIRAIEALQESSIGAADSLHQRAFATFVEQTGGDLPAVLADTRALYHTAAQVMSEALDASGLPHIPSAGGPFNAVKVGEDGSKFAERMLREHVLEVVPGWSFGESMQSAIRISTGPLVTDPDSIREGLRHLKP